MSRNRVLVVNAGSSSLKFKLYDIVNRALTPVVSGLLERIGDVKNSSITIKVCIESAGCSSVTAPG
jgi:acetate kinase